MKQHIVLCLMVIAVVGARCSMVPREHSRGAQREVAHAVSTLVRTEILPALKDQEFLQRPTIIVAGNIGETARIAPTIDALTALIRDEIIQGLINMPGAYPVQRSRIRAEFDPSKTARLLCGRGAYTIPETALLLDVSVTDQVTVNIAAVNLAKNNEFIKYSSRTFTMEPTVGMHALAHQVTWDEYLQGTKHLPMSAGDIDGIASFLAYNFVCVLQEQPLPRDVKLYVPLPRIAPYEDNIIAQLHHYLTKYGIAVTDSDEPATHVLEITVSPDAAVAPETTVMWLRMKDKNGTYVQYASTKVYYTRETPLTAAVVPRERLDQGGVRILVVYEGDANGPVIHDPNNAATEEGKRVARLILKHLQEHLPRNVEAVINPPVKEGAVRDPSRLPVVLLKLSAHALVKDYQNTDIKLSLALDDILFERNGIRYRLSCDEITALRNEINAAFAAQASNLVATADVPSFATSFMNIMLAALQKPQTQAFIDKGAGFASCGKILDTPLTNEQLTALLPSAAQPVWLTYAPQEQRQLLQDITRISHIHRIEVPEAVLRIKPELIADAVVLRVQGVSYDDIAELDFKIKANGILYSTASVEAATGELTIRAQSLDALLHDLRAKHQLPALYPRVFDVPYAASERRLLVIPDEEAEVFIQILRHNEHLLKKGLIGVVPSP